MNARRALLLVIAIGGLCMLWAASRYARQIDARRTDVAEAATGARNHDTDCAIHLLIPGG